MDYDRGSVEENEEEVNASSFMPENLNKQIEETKNKVYKVMYKENIRILFQFPLINFQLSI